MPDAVSSPSQPVSGVSRPFSGFVNRISAEFPSLAECGVATGSAALLIFSFPDFNLWPLAWIALGPLLLLIVRNPWRPWRSFLLGWLFGSIFFYGSCYWLTYSMIHFGGFPVWLAFLALLPGAIVMGIFPALFATVVACVVRKWGSVGLFLSPLCWVAFEWARLGTTGQLWNALGYTQAYHPSLIQCAAWGGVYAVSFMIVLVNAAAAYALLRRDVRALVGSTIVVVLVFSAAFFLRRPPEQSGDDATVIAIQPNVPMDLVKTTDEMAQLTDRHFQMSEAVLTAIPFDGQPRLLVWPESPMNFTYGTDSSLREKLTRFAKLHHTSILLNSQEVAPNDGIYNSALLINEQGGMVSQYDKIRLLPFGEYVPLPQWMPGAGLIKAVVGDFTPGSAYRLMSVGTVRAGVFICIESAYPAIAREFTRGGADVLINISNDGYLGPTAVMRQHLANAVLRAVENKRPVLRITNSGITAMITPRGEVRDATEGFTQAVRTWKVARSHANSTFYAKHGDLFVAACACLSFLILVFSCWPSSLKR